MGIHSSNGWPPVYATPNVAETFHRHSEIHETAWKKLKLGKRHRKLDIP